MSVEILNELESAAKIVLAPPNLITNEQRHLAESVFLSFRESKAPYALCKHILETSHIDYVIFETAGTLKEALIREWNQLQDSEKIELRQYLFNYVLGKPSLPPFVRERILQVLAIMVKRGSVTDWGNERRKILEEVESLIMNGDFSRQILGCSIISAMMQEYSNTIKSSDVGVTWETHFQAKKEFELSDLKRVLGICVRALREVLKFQPPYSDQVNTLVRNLLTISESVFTWGFISTSFRLPKRLLGAFELSYVAENSPPLKLSPAWKDIINSQLVQLYFDILWKVRDNPTLAHHSLTCLSQLASLNGSIFSSQEEILNYFNPYIKSLIKFLTSVEILDREALGVSNIIRNLVIYFFPMLASNCFEDIHKQFLEQMARLTCFFSVGAAHEESMHADDCMFREAFEVMLTSLISGLDEMDYFSQEFFKQLCSEVFNTYLKCHLAPPDGTRGSGKDLEEEEIDESEESDHIRFKGQLQAMGVVGRRILEHSFPLLIRCLEMRTAHLSSHLQKIHENSLNIADNNILQNLFEDLHWLLLISGYMIALDCEGEKCLISSSIMTYSIKQSGNIEASLKLLASPHLSHSDIPDADSADHLLRLVAAVFRLCEMESKVVNAGLTHLLSPELTSTLQWFLKVWAVSFLVASECFYEEISMAIVSGFGQNSEGAVWCINYLLSRVEMLLRTFPSEPTIAEGTIKLLQVLTDISEKAVYALKSPCLGRLLEMQQGSLPLPRIVRQGLMKSFVMVSLGFDDAAKRKEYWAQVITPVEARFRGVISKPDFRKTYQEEAVRAEVILLLESYIGIVNGSDILIVHDLFNFVYPVLYECANLLSIYCHYKQIIELILEMYHDAAKLMLCYLTAEESRRFFDASLRAVQSYAQSNYGRRSLEPSAEEEAYNDIQILMDLLAALISKDILFLSPSESGQESGGDNGVAASEVTLYGLSIIMPLMTVDLLKFPSLSKKYYELIHFVCEIHPDKVLKQPPAMLSALLGTVEFGLTSFSQEAALCCNFLHALASHIHSSGNNTTFALLVPFLKLVMDMILFRQVNSDILHNIGLAFFSLICCYQDEYKRLVDFWIQSQSDRDVGARLAQAFNDLTTGLQLNTDRQQRARFMDNFDKFVIKVHGFLFVK